MKLGRAIHAIVEPTPLVGADLVFFEQTEPARTKIAQRAAFTEAALRARAEIELHVVRRALSVAGAPELRRERWKATEARCLEVLGDATPRGRPSAPAGADSPLVAKAYERLNGGRIAPRQTETERLAELEELADGYDAAAAVLFSEIEELRVEASVILAERRRPARVAELRALLPDLVALARKVDAMRLDDREILAAGYRLMSQTYPTADGFQILQVLSMPAETASLIGQFRSWCDGAEKTP